jgi:hypothetical protein
VALSAADVRCECGANVNVIIACAGRHDDPKWNNYLNVPKHLAPVDGTSLLVRTVEQVNRRINKHRDRIIITGPPDDHRYKVNGAELVVANPAATSEYTSSMPWWCTRDRTLLLLGDVYWTERALGVVFAYRSNRPRWFGRYGKSRVTASRWGEIFGVLWPATCNGLMKQHLTRVDSTPEITRPPGWKLYRSLHSIPMSKHKLNGDWTDINDETDDFDTPETYLKHPAVKRAWRIER